MECYYPDNVQIESMNDNKLINFNLKSYSQIDFDYDSTSYLYFVNEEINIIPTYTANVVSFEISEGQLPQGLTLNSYTGAITGVVSILTSKEVTIKLTDTYYDPVYRTITITVLDKLTSITYSSTDVIAYTTNSYEQTPTLTGLTNNYTITGTNLPTGLSVNTTTGKISGTLSNVVSQYESIITLTNIHTFEDGSTYNEVINVTINFDIRLKITLSYSNLFEYYINDSITSQNTAITPVTTGTINAFEKISGTLPTGLSLNTSTGKIYGTPTTSGNYTITIKAKNNDDNNNYDTFEFTISIKPTPTITYKTITVHINTTFYVTPTLTNTNNPKITLLTNTNDIIVQNSTTGLLKGLLTVGGQKYTITLRMVDTIKNSSKTINTSRIAVYTKYLPTINYSNTNVAINTSFTITPAKSNTNTTTWTVSPSSLSINSSGVVSGKYTTSGSRSVSVTLTDKVTNTTVSVTDSFTITVNTLPTITFPSTIYCCKTFEYKKITPTVSKDSSVIKYTTSSTLPTGISLNYASSFTGIALTTGDYTVNVTCKYYSANISKTITFKCVDILEDIGGWIVNLNCPFKFKLNCDWPITSASIYNTEGLITIDTDGYITCVNGFNKICAIYPVIELQVTDPLGVSHKLIKYLTISVRCNGSTNFNYFANTNRYKYKLNKDICIEPIHTVSDIFDNFEGTNYQLLTEDENLDLSVNSNGVITGSASKVGDYEVYVRWYNNNGEYMDARIYLIIHTIDIYSLQHNIYRPIDFRNSFIKITK